MKGKYQHPIARFYVAPNQGPGPKHALQHALLALNRELNGNKLIVEVGRDNPHVTVYADNYVAYTDHTLSTMVNGLLNKIKSVADQNNRLFREAEYPTGNAFLDKPTRKGDEPLKAKYDELRRNYKALEETNDAVREELQRAGIQRDNLEERIRALNPTAAYKEGTDMNSAWKDNEALYAIQQHELMVSYFKDISDKLENRGLTVAPSLAEKPSRVIEAGKTLANKKVFERLLEKMTEDARRSMEGSWIKAEIIIKAYEEGVRFSEEAYQRELRDNHLKVPVYARRISKDEYELSIPVKAAVQEGVGTGIYEAFLSASRALTENKRLSHSLVNPYTTVVVPATRTLAIFKKFEASLKEERIAYNLSFEYFSLNTRDYKTMRTEASKTEKPEHEASYPNILARKLGEFLRENSSARHNIPAHIIRSVNDGRIPRDKSLKLIADKMGVKVDTIKTWHVE